MKWKKRKENQIILMHFMVQKEENKIKYPKIWYHQPIKIHNELILLPWL
jgi:hypothetical protein